MVGDVEKTADLIESGLGPGCVVPGLLGLRLLLRQRCLKLLHHRLAAEHRKRTAKKMTSARSRNEDPGPDTLSSQKLLCRTRVRHHVNTSRTV